MKVTSKTLLTLVIVLLAATPQSLTPAKQGDCCHRLETILLKLLKDHGTSFLLKDLKRAWMTKAVGLLHPFSLH
jgi:hypothetical protein